MERDLQSELQTLNRLYKEADHIYTNLAVRFGLSDTEFWILYAISHTEGQMTQNDLCNDFFFPVQTINSAISKLQKKDLVELKVIPQTRNRKAILLTDKGKDFVSKTINKVDEIERNAFLMFTEKERETYLSLFKRHIENLKIEEARVLDSISDRSERE